MMKILPSYVPKMLYCSIDGQKFLVICRAGACLEIAEVPPPFFNFCIGEGRKAFIEFFLSIYGE
ncbi:hypothetical protein X975_05349, partial [Stegodyphus mimosarum]